MIWRLYKIQTEKIQRDLSDVGYFRWEDLKKVVFFQISVRVILFRGRTLSAIMRIERRRRERMNIKESELRKKLDLVVDKLLNLGGPDNAKELEESGGEAIGFFARDFRHQGVGLAAGSRSVRTAEDHAV